MTSVEEKLKKFQDVCEDKLRRVEALKQAHERNGRILREQQIDEREHLEIAELRFQIAQKQLKIGNRAAGPRAENVTYVR
jgi:hypothetical protein